MSRGLFQFSDRACRKELTLDGTRCNANDGEAPQKHLADYGRGTKKPSEDQPRLRESVVAFLAIPR